MLIGNVRFLKRSMYHWRSDGFEALNEAANYASSVPGWAEYALFCQLLGKGLRKDAFRHLEAFAQQAAQWPLSERKMFVSWVNKLSYSRIGDLTMLIPAPLRIKLIEPTLVEWAVSEPGNGEPLRWLGSPEHLAEAIRLDPSDNIARERLIEWHIRGIEYSTHELPAGYLGEPEEDLRVLEQIESISNGLYDAGTKARYLGHINELRETINAYLRGEAGT